MEILNGKKCEEISPSEEFGNHVNRAANEPMRLDKTSLRYSYLNLTHILCFAASDVWRSVFNPG